MNGNYFERFFKSRKFKSFAQRYPTKFLIAEVDFPLSIRRDRLQLETRLFNLGKRFYFEILLLMRVRDIEGLKQTATSYKNFAVQDIYYKKYLIRKFFDLEIVIHKRSLRECL